MQIALGLEDNSYSHQPEVCLDESMFIYYFTRSLLCARQRECSGKKTKPLPVLQVPRAEGEWLLGGHLVVTAEFPWKQGQGAPFGRGGKASRSSYQLLRAGLKET